MTPAPHSSKDTIVYNDLSQIDKEKFVAEYEKKFKPADFTIKELRDVVPPHLFEKNVLKATAYLIANLAICAALFYLALHFDEKLPYPLAYVAWPIYWWVQGIHMMGIWVIAHECGHQSFANSKTVNNVMGLILHSALLVPYHCWRISHAHHHATTGNMDQDNVHLPKRRSEFVPEEGHQSAWKEAIADSPIYHFYCIMISLLFGWPAHLIFNLSGQKYGRPATYFLPSSPMFEKKHRTDVLVSDACLAVAFGVLGYVIYQTSFWTVVKYYGIPYLAVNGWLVTITLLHHTDVYLPHYTSKSWNFVRGALTTVDRDYGWYLNHAFHHIHDSHVAHHFFSQMPHFNAIKATPYLKKKLGQYYLYDQTPVFSSLMRAFGRCNFIEDTGDVLFYRRKWYEGKKQ